MQLGLFFILEGQVLVSSRLKTIYKSTHSFVYYHTIYHSSSLLSTAVLILIS